MTTEYIAIPADTDPDAERIAAAKETVQAQIQRADAKATSLLSFFGGALAGVLALPLAGISQAATVLLYLAALPTAASVVLLLWVIRPYLGGSAQTGFTRWSLFVADPAALVADLDRPCKQSTEDQAHHLAVLSRLAMAKYERIAHAVYLLLTGLAIAALALLAA